MRRLIISLEWLALAVVEGGSFRAAAGEECTPAGGLSFVCGPVAAEDLVRVPGTRWIIGSGLAEKGKPGKLHLINAETRSWEVLYPGANPRNVLDAGAYSGCAGAPDAKTFGAHGIAIRDDGNRASTVLAVNHGREAIEVFSLDSSGAKPEIRWVGCVPMDQNTYLNSVAFLPGGGFVATKFFDPKAPGGFRSIMDRKATGGVLEWHRETGVRQIPGTDLVGANGIVVSKDGKSIYVAAWGTQELVRFSLGDGLVSKKIVLVEFFPDNLRWAPDGTILVAGQNGEAKADGGFPGFKGWTVVKLDPETLKVTVVLKDSGESPMQNASVAIDVDGTLWMGTFGGDRVAYKPAR
jgi:sugar lactone lactonase YvrE